MEFTLEMVRVMDAMAELECALNDLGESLVKSGVMNENLVITSGVADCGITDNKGFWHHISHIDDLTDRYSLSSTIRIANECYIDTLEG